VAITPKLGVGPGTAAGAELSPLGGCTDGVAWLSDGGREPPVDTGAGVAFDAAAEAGGAGGTATVQQCQHQLREMVRASLESQRDGLPDGVAISEKSGRGTTAVEITVGKCRIYFRGPGCFEEPTTGSCAAAGQGLESGRIRHIQENVQDKVVAR
jgi:hypothetical protein